MRHLCLVVFFLMLAILPTVVTGVEPLMLETVQPPPTISPDEPLGEFSLERAAVALDRAALHWQKTRACTACHTMLPYLMARPVLNGVLRPSGEVRQFFEEVVSGQREAMPDYSCHDVDGAVAIGVATALSLNDRGTTGKLHPLTRQTLDRMWTLQRSDGSWEWPFRDTPPFKVREHFGVTLAAVAVGMAPDAYNQTPAAQTGLAGIRRYLGNAPPVTLHEQAMLLWASVNIEGLLSDKDRTEAVSRLMNVQRPDGGWSLASLVDNTSDPSLKGQPQVASLQSEAGYGTKFLGYIGRDHVYKSALDSDGYTTGLVLLITRRAGLPATDARLQRGVNWLKTHQRESGRWFTPSQAWHTQHFISNAGTAFAVLGLHACGEIPSR